MKKLLLFALLCFVSSPVASQRLVRQREILAPRGYRPLAVDNSIELQLMLEKAVKESFEEFRPANFRPDEMAVTLIDLSDSKHPRRAEIRGEEPIYPASVVKVFYLVALEQQLEDKKVKETPELTRGMHDMIVDSSNEATQYILDVLTGTSSGPELPKPEFNIWQFKRNRVNRYFASMGFANINVNQKTFCEDAYGIEQQSRHYKGENRNMLTTNATARLLAEMVMGRFNTPERTRRMMELLRRDPFSEKTGTDESQAHDFTGKLLIDRKMTDAKLWSKAGWTSKARHDAAYIETADGLKFVLVVFTENHATEKDPIPMIAGKVIDKLRSK